MIVRGRDKPVADISAHEGGVSIRVDFVLQPSLWLELHIDLDELRRLVSQVEREQYETSNSLRA